MSEILFGKPLVEVFPGTKKTVIINLLNNNRYAWHVIEADGTDNGGMVDTFEQAVSEVQKYA